MSDWQTTARKEETGMRRSERMKIQLIDEEDEDIEDENLEDDEEDE